MFHVMLQPEELTYNTKIFKCLKQYALCFDSHRSHSKKTSDGKQHKLKHFMQNGALWTVTVKMYKLQKSKTNTGANLAYIWF